MGNKDVFRRGENWELASNPWSANGKRTDTGIVGMTLYDNVAQTMISGTTFRNFNGPDDVALVQPVKYNEFPPQGLATFANLRFENTKFKRRLVLNRGKICLPRCGASQYGQVMDHDGSLSNLFNGAVLGFAENDNRKCKVTCRGKNWWQLDDGCKKIFDEFPGTAKGGWWACPKLSPHTWAKTERHIVSIVLVSGNKFNERPALPRITDRGAVLLSPATKHANWQTQGTRPIPGAIYHFGTKPRLAEIGFESTSAAVQVTGACCEIGWYLVPDGKAPGVLSILLEQVGKDHGPVFA